MKYFSFLIIAASVLAVSCKKAGNKPILMQTSINNTIDSLVSKYGEPERERIEKGVEQTASFWLTTNGSETDFMNFCMVNYIADKEMLDKVYRRISDNFESIFGYYNKISVNLQRPLHLDIGEILPIDEKFGAYSPSTHFTDDFFNNKLAFIITLNFPYYTLEEKTARAGTWSRKEWGYARLGDVFDSRLPANVSQLVVEAYTKSDMYIADYNIFAGNLIDEGGKRLFPADMKLLSHWNIRDEIKSNYGKENGLDKQRMLYEVMKRIISQEIPVSVINSATYTWNPYSNKVFENNQEVSNTPEPFTRYKVLLDFFHAQQKVDQYYPELNTYIKRNFGSDMEIPIEDVETLFAQYLSSPEVTRVAANIRNRLGRDLEPFDIWYDGFKTRSSIAADKLNEITTLKYPDRKAVQDDLPEILSKMGFSREKAMDISSRIIVEPARGSGHAWGSEIRGENSLLRTRIFSNGMDYKGYNIAVHEFGHNVEQTISLYNIDEYMLHGVPNTAFTEALAFMFQKNDLRLLGLKDEDERQVYLNNLDKFWSLYEIMGVSLVDIGIWKWLYANPEADAASLEQAVTNVAMDIWNKYYAPVFGINDQPVFAIYSHIINAPLYLTNYAYGDIIEFQLAEYLEGKDFATEIERIYSLGRLTPQEWMKEATGNPISVEPIMHATQEAVLKIR